MVVRLRFERSKAELVYPVGRAPRTAVLVPWFREAGEVRVFRRGWSMDAAVFAPQSIAATWPQLEKLIAHEIVPPERSVLVLLRPGDPLLTVAQRDRLWRAFGVPVFQQIVGRDGEALAVECEAHEGLHVEGDLTGYPMVQGVCGCGRSGARIVGGVRAAGA